MASEPADTTALHVRNPASSPNVLVRAKEDMGGWITMMEDCSPITLLLRNTPLSRIYQGPVYLLTPRDAPSTGTR